MLPSEKEKDLLGGLIRQNGRGQRGTKALLSHLRRRAVKTTNSVGGDTVCSGRRFAPYPASGPLKSGWTSPTHILNLGDKSEGTTPKARPPATNFLTARTPVVCSSSWGQTWLQGRLFRRPQPACGQNWPPTIQGTIRRISSSGHYCLLLGDDGVASGGEVCVPFGFGIRAGPLHFNPVRFRGAAQTEDFAGIVR
jgi:hypothetical protein